MWTSENRGSYGNTPVFRGDGFNWSMQHTLKALWTMRITVYAETSPYERSKESGYLE